MTREFISKRTRSQFREFLAGWTLREIEMEFEGADVECDRSFEAEVSGQRRSLVEQYYRTLDFAKPDDVRRILAAYQSIVEHAEGKLPTSYGREDAEQRITQLKACLARDGFAYSDGCITATTPESRVVFEQLRSISEVTRRRLFNELNERSWAGALGEPEFLERICDSNNSGHQSSIYGAWQHRVRNLDWDNDWVFKHSGLDLLNSPDDFLLRFLCEVLHPAVRPDERDAQNLASVINERISIDGWELVEGGRISGRPTFIAVRTTTGGVSLSEPANLTDVFSNDYVREISKKCDDRLTSADLDGAITAARTMLEAVLVELEKKLAGAHGDYKGDLPKQFKAVAKQLRIDDERADLDDNFKQVARGLVQVVNGLAPIRNKMSDGHARERKPEVHHARVIVNAAQTVATFLVESYLVQRERGLLTTPTNSLNDVERTSGGAA